MPAASRRKRRTSCMTATTTASGTTATSAFHCRARRSRWNPRSRQPAGDRHRARRSAGRTGCRAAPVGRIASAQRAHQQNDLIIVREARAFMLHKDGRHEPRARRRRDRLHSTPPTTATLADAQSTDTGKDLDGATGALRIDGAAARSRAAATASGAYPAGQRLAGNRHRRGPATLARAGRRHHFLSFQRSRQRRRGGHRAACVQPNQSLRMRYSVRVDDDHAGPRRQRRRAELHAAALPDGVRAHPSNTVPVMIDGPEART